MPLNGIRSKKRNKVILEPSLPESELVLPVSILLLKIEDLRERYLLLPDTVSYGPKVTFKADCCINACRSIAQHLQEALDLLSKPASFGLNAPLSPILRAAERALTAQWGLHYDDNIDVLIVLLYELDKDVLLPLRSFLNEYSGKDALGKTDVR